MVRQRNSGVSGARNAGLHAARGEFVDLPRCRRRADPEAVETGVRTLTSNPSAVCAVGRVRPMDVNGRDLPSVPPRPVVRDLYREWLYENFVFTPGAAVFRRHSLLESMGGFPDRGRARCRLRHLPPAGSREQILDHATP